MSLTNTALSPEELAFWTPDDSLVFTEISRSEPGYGPDEEFRPEGAVIAVRRFQAQRADGAWRTFSLNVYPQHVGESEALTIEGWVEYEETGDPGEVIGRGIGGAGDTLVPAGTVVNVAEANRLAQTLVDQLEVSAIKESKIIDGSILRG